MVRKTAMGGRPSLILATVGGAVATVLLAALFHLAPVAGLPFLDPFRLIGGLFTASPEAATWLGFAIFLVLGWFVFAPALVLTWTSLPGGNEGFAGAVPKALVGGVALFVLAGIAYPLLGEWNRVAAVEGPGWFGLGGGAGGLIVLLVGHVAYALAAALVAAMSRNISPPDTIGWSSHGAGRAA